MELVNLLNLIIMKIDIYTEMILTDVPTLVAVAWWCLVRTTDDCG